MIENLRNFKKPKLEKVHHTQDIQKISDPVEDFRNEFDTMIPDYEIGSSFEDVGYEPTEEEEYIFRNDPEFKELTDEMLIDTATEDVFSLIGSNYYNPETDNGVVRQKEGGKLDGVWDVEYEKPEKSAEQIASQNKNYRINKLKVLLDDDYTDLETPFEERDLIFESMKKDPEKYAEYKKNRDEKIKSLTYDQAYNKIQELGEKRDNHELLPQQETTYQKVSQQIDDKILERRAVTKKLHEVPLYPKNVFKMIKVAALVYEAREAAKDIDTKKFTKPRFSDGNELTVEQIAEEVEKHEKRHTVPRDTYSNNQLKLMSYCKKYTEIKKILDTARKPVLSMPYEDKEGKTVRDVYNDAQIKELAEEYFDLRDNNFVEFVKSQVEAGIWKLKDFNWKREEYNGRTQWTSSEVEYGADKKKKTRKHVSMQEPLPIEDNSKLYAYTRKPSKTIKRNDGSELELVNVKIHTPTPKKVLTTKEDSVVV